MSKGSDPAYPVSETVGERGDYRDVLTGGLTKREAFATAAMQGQLSSGIPGEHYRPAECARLAVEFADALLAELAKERNDEQ